MSATKGPKNIPDAMWNRARARHDNGESWEAISHDTRISVERLRRKLDPGYADRRNAQHKRNVSRKAKFVRDGSAGYVLRGMTLTEVMAALAKNGCSRIVMHSAKLTLIADARRDRDTRVEDVWAAYVKAKTKADETHRIEDGIAAGKLWKRFLELIGGPF